MNFGARDFTATLRSRPYSGARMAVILPSSQAEADASLGAGSCVVNFCASWAEPCAQLNTVFVELSGDHANLKFIQAYGRILERKRRLPGGCAPHGPRPHAPTLCTAHATNPTVCARSSTRTPAPIFATASRSSPSLPSFSSMRES